MFPLVTMQPILSAQHDEGFLVHYGPRQHDWILFEYSVRSRTRYSTGMSTIGILCTHASLVSLVVVSLLWYSARIFGASPDVFGATGQHVFFFISPCVFVRASYIWCLGLLHVLVGLQYIFECLDIKKTIASNVTINDNVNHETPKWNYKWTSVHYRPYIGVVDESFHLRLI